MMKFLLFLILTQYAVNCDDTSNYYVIEIPEDPPRDFKKPFRVFWNVPTMQCRSKKVHFHLDTYGILQNKDDSFRGDQITILYDPGLFPALLKNESSGELKFRNGGVPQEGDMDLHLEEFRRSLEQSVPDENFNGVGIIDFESWRPVFRQNFGVLVPYKDVSYAIEKKLHWWWPKNWVHAEAKRRFEAAGRSFMQTTLSIAKQMRPKAQWGYYAFPYCFNMAPSNKLENCTGNIRRENDDAYWLWSESTALYPSVYSSRDLSSSDLAALIRGRVREASRVMRKSTPVLPYFWFRYRDGGYMSEEDLSAALKALYNSDASGFIIWGSSNDVNTVDKCLKLHNYVESILGPAVAKYTKNFVRGDEMPLVTEAVDVKESPNNTSANANVSSTIKIDTTVENTTVVNTKFIPIDPEFPWVPPANYSQEINQYVEEELAKKSEYDKTNIDNESIKIFNESLLMDIIMNSLLHVVDVDRTIDSKNDRLNSTNETRNVTLKIDNTTQLNNASDIELVTSTKIPIFTELPYFNSIATSNPLEQFNTNKIESITEMSLLNNGNTQTVQYLKESDTTVQNDIYTDMTTESYDETFSNNNPLMYDDEMLFSDVTESSDVTTEYYNTVSNDTSILNKDIFENTQAVTEKEELLSTTVLSTTSIAETTTNSENNESTELITDNVDVMDDFMIEGDFSTSGSEGTDFTDSSIDNFTNDSENEPTESSDLLKNVKKESTGRNDEGVTSNSTSLPLTEETEAEQVVVYIS